MYSCNVETVQVSCTTKVRILCSKLVSIAKKRHRCVRKCTIRATRLVVENKFLSFYQRLAELGLTTLETRRLLGDLIEVLKFFKDLYLSTTLNSFNCQIMVYAVICINYSSHRFGFSVRVIDRPPWNIAMWNSG